MSAIPSEPEIPLDPRAATPALTVADLLTLDVMQRGRPEILAGTDLAKREVRWVHTSEIYEIAPLLKGGEALLTTGLGLVGASSPELDYYATALANRAVAVLLLELGRTFAKAPPALVEAAQRAGLPLVTLRGIVPFVDITEHVHTLLITGEVGRLRLAQHVDAVVTSSLLAGGGISDLLREIAALADAPVRLYGDDNHLVAAHDIGRSIDVDDETLWPVAAVELRGTTWGRLVICGQSTVARSIAAERGAIAIALELGRAGSGSGGPSRRRAGATLLRDIFGRQYSSADEITGRAAALGLAIRTGAPAIGICLAVDTGGAASTAPSGSILGAVTDASERVFGSALVTELDGAFLIATTTPDDPRDALATLADTIDAALPYGRAVAVVAGPSAADVPALSRSLRLARESSVLARRLRSGMRTLLVSDLGVHRLLTRFATDPELAAFVDEQLGPLLDYDAVHERELVRTLDTLLACGLSKAAAARALRIRRQTLYQRLDTAARLLGGLDLASRERRTSLDLALVGWRLRTAGTGVVHN